MDRRDFLKTSAALAGGLAWRGGLSSPLPPLSFSTLGCPDWSFDQVLDFAGAHGYDAVEIRGIRRQLDLPSLPAFSTASQARETARKVKEKGLKISDLGSSAEMHHLDPKERAEQITAARRFIDLAYELDCPYVRVFPNRLPPEQDRKATLDIMGQTMGELAEFARGSGVSVLMETHGDMVHPEDLVYVMQAARHPQAGLLWDIYNMWSITRQPPKEVYTQIRSYVKHTHIKDGHSVNGKEAYCLLGKGDSPIFEAIDLLYDDHYAGYYSFEWEKLWHPDIAEPEVALADYPEAMKAHFSSR